jgi:hypothetical protein
MIKLSIIFVTKFNVILLFLYKTICKISAVIMNKTMNIIQLYTKFEFRRKRKMKNYPQGYNDKSKMTDK